MKEFGGVYSDKGKRKICCCLALAPVNEGVFTIDRFLMKKAAGLSILGNQIWGLLCVLLSIIIVCIACVTRRSRSSRNGIHGAGESFSRWSHVFCLKSHSFIDL